MAEMRFEFAEVVSGGEAMPADPASSRRRDLGSTSTAICWLSAAALAVYAPLTRVYTFWFDPQNSESVDGWGRIRLVGPNVGAPDGHAARYGIGFVVVAALLVILALARLALFSRFAAAGRAVAIVLPSLLAGIVLAVGLDLQAFLDQVHRNAQSARASGATDGPATIPYAHAGPCFWLALAALVAAVTGSVLDVVLRSRRLPASADDATSPPETTDMAADSETDVLG